MKDTFYHSSTYRNFDEFEEGLTAWDIEIYQLEGGVFSNQLRQFSTGGMLISEAEFGGKTHQIGSSPSGMTVAFITDSNQPLYWRNTELPANSLMIFPQDREFDVTTGIGKTQVMTVSFPEDKLADLCTEEEAEYILGVLSTCESLHLDDSFFQTAQNQIAFYFNKLSENIALLDVEHLKREIEANVLGGIIRSICSSKPSHRKGLVGDRTARSRLDELIRSSSFHQLSIGEICEETEISERSLLRYFQKKFGVSTKKFINTVRLNKVRNELKKSGCGRGVVSDIANRWGFWHMGQFAKDYRSLFDELPSETLNKS
jgi:AraC-like DNA-binding protein